VRGIARHALKLGQALLGEGRPGDPNGDRVAQPVRRAKAARSFLMPTSFKAVAHRKGLRPTDRVVKRDN
jgi:hypothetical protein